MSKIIKNDLSRFFEQFPRENYFIYGVIDAAQDSSFLKRKDILQSRNILVEAAGDKASELSPHLIQLSHNINSSEWEYINHRIVGTSRMTLIVTRLTFDDLYAHLRQFIDVKFEGGLEMYLAFWDPAILGTLVGQKTDKTLYVQQQVLLEEQKKILLKPIYSWWYWDRIGQLHTIIGYNNCELQIFYDWRQPFEFTIEQEELMVEATFPDHLIYYLKLNNPFLIKSFNNWDLYLYVIEMLKKAREYSLNGTRDILNFICLTLIYKDKFESDMFLQSILLKVKNKIINMDQAMEEAEDLMQLS